MMRRVDLHSHRLHIRYFEQKDLENCYQFKTQVFKMKPALSEVQGWLRWTIDSYRELASLFQPPYSDYAIELKPDGEFIGSVGIVPSVVPWGVLENTAAVGHHSLLKPEVGLFWGIMPAFRRQGYASEAAAAVIHYLFAEWNLQQVVATTEYDNIASQKTMEKLGMTLYRNPAPEPPWCQVVGRIKNPKLR